MKLSDAVQKVINLARRVREYYAVELPKHHPHFPVVDLLEPNPPSPTEERELRAFLSSLPHDSVYQLLLLMYLGRGDFGVDDLADNFAVLKKAFSKPEFAISQMMDKTPLADYLSDGMEELRNRDINVDRMPLKRITTKTP